MTGSAAGRIASGPPTLPVASCCRLDCAIVALRTLPVDLLVDAGEQGARGEEASESRSDPSTVGWMRRKGEEGEILLPCARGGP